jgi:glycosyltransferase A (GT-A) superfamily protein (DUF2064 family)/8-oxo-dGTP pyrophosphatase MutT (NUDIX family)
MVNNKKNSNVVIIFAKKPELGRVKTRIAEETSDKFAYDFAKACLTDLLHKINNSDYYDLIVGVDTLEDLEWFQKNFSLEGLLIKKTTTKNKQELQSNKFTKIFKNLLNKYKYKKAVLIPMDIPFISEEDLITAFARLEHYNFVHGPEVNGGIYLIGLKAPFTKNVFKKVRWSTTSSYEDLVDNCGKSDTFSLKLKNDLNLPADILKLRDEIYHTCPIVFEFLEKNNYYFSVKDKYINFDDLSICIPVVSNIIQKENEKNKIEILIQTRYKPSVDPKNTGKVEIPSGLMKRYELAQDAVIRETFEETGIVSEIVADYHVIIKTKQKNGNEVAMFKPFYCQQQLQGDRAYLSLVFVSNYIRGKLTENPLENKNLRWVDLDEIKKIIKDNPDKIFSLSLAAIQEYLKFKKQL